MFDEYEGDGASLYNLHKQIGRRWIIRIDDDSVQMIPTLGRGLINLSAQYSHLIESQTHPPLRPRSNHSKYILLLPRKWVFFPPHRTTRNVLSVIITLVKYAAGINGRIFLPQTSFCCRVVSHASGRGVVEEVALRWRRDSPDHGWCWTSDCCCFQRLHQADVWLPPTFFFFLLFFSSIFSWLSNLVRLRCDGTKEERTKDNNQ